MQAQFLSIDTSFKRIHHKWQEFEIESWDVNYMRCKDTLSVLICTAFTPNLAVVGVRAFTTSQSAEAHVILFQRIFDFATEDTKIPVRFNHIHGSGFLLWIADAHMGQALGINSA